MTVSEVQTKATSITANELYAKLLKNEPSFILDVRNEEDFKRWRVEGRAALEVMNLPYYDFIEDEDAAVARVPKDREILAICAKEGASQYVADILTERGMSASYLQGGITTWGNYYHVRDVVNESYGR
ncbi:MAG: MBL fold metallo-hydrolase, partial [Chloroflexales bacterium]|nr:MBL fold metallo-hydrolase [Chloroflexales bacterium]